LLEKKEHIDDLFAGYLSNYEVKAPNYVWQNIQMDLKKDKARRKASIIRAMAASIALFIAFGLGYFSSDFSQKQILTASNLNENQNVVLEKNQTELMKSDFEIQNALEKNSNKNYIAESQAIAIKQTGNGSFLYKWLERKNNIFLRNNNYQKKSIVSNENKNISKEKTTNQLLIDTLLFKKENLPEGGFLFNEKKESKSRWSFGTKFSPVYSLAENMNKSGSQANTQSLKSIRDNDIPNTKADEKSLMSYTGGINVNYHFTRRWSLESGLFYSEYRQMAENLVSSSLFGTNSELSIYTPEGIKYIQPTGIAEPGTSQIIGSTMDETYYSLNMNYVSNFDYIELPLIIRYKIIDRKLGLDVLSGISTNFLVSGKSTIMYNNNDLWTGTSEGISPMLYNATFGLGLNYDIYHNFSLNIEPTFKYSIFTTQSELLRYPYRFAVFAGFSYRF
jgi:hypothetical protein